MYCEYSSCAGSISAFDTAHILRVLTLFGVFYALLCRFYLFPLQADGCSVLRILSCTRSTWGFCFEDSDSQYVPAIFPPFQYWFYWDYVVSVRFNAITDSRSLAMTNQPDRFMGGNGEDIKWKACLLPPPSSLNDARFKQQQKHSSAQAQRCRLS